MIERDEAALQALQKMYHDEDYAMDLVKQAADRLGNFQPAVAAARVMKSLVQIPRLKDTDMPASSIDARRTQEFDSLEHMLLTADQDTLRATVLAVVEVELVCRRFSDFEPGPVGNRMTEMLEKEHRTRCGRVSQRS